MINQPKLNLACGSLRVDDYFGIDIIKTDAVDAVMDLQSYPWDIASDSAEEIICAHYVEHIPMDSLSPKLLEAIFTSLDFKELRDKVDVLYSNPPKDGLIQFMEEIWRILKPGGKLYITCPHFNSEATWQDPTHRRAITESTFFYFNKQWRINSNLIHYPIETDFIVKFNGYQFFKGLENKSKEEKAFSIQHLTNFVAFIHFVITKPLTLTK
jgi:predicted SAM-dependent methyltransferase